jgi:uncharacterized RDD family membrane protein YckC
MDNTTVPVPPVVQVPQSPTSSASGFVVASLYKRLGNMVLDSIISGIAVTLISSAIFGFGTESLSSSLLIIVLSISYYTVSEVLWQKTPAKFITGTKVVMRDGSKAPFKNILGRSFARIIPFEQLSFLFRKYPIGWHDQLSGTVVVDASATQEQVAALDFVTLKQQKATGVSITILLAVLLIPVLIIVILVGVVFSSLNTARSKGDATKARYEKSMKDIENRVIDKETKTKAEQF